MREIAWGCVTAPMSLMLAVARFRHADRVARRLIRDRSDGLRRLIDIDAAVLRWDPPASAP
jgi:hypothetical protein